MCDSIRHDEDLSDAGLLTKWLHLIPVSVLGGPEDGQGPLSLGELKAMATSVSEDQPGMETLAVALVSSP